jgi:DNA-binding response OmpR family regulator
MQQKNQYKPMTASILYVSANQNSIENIANKFLKRYAQTVFSATTLNGAKKIFLENEIDILICDTEQSDGYYFNFLQELKSLNNDFLHILLSDGKEENFDQNVKTLHSFAYFIRPIKSTLFLQTMFDADKTVATNKKNALLQKESILDEIFRSQGENAKIYLQKCPNPSAYVDENMEILQFNEPFEKLFPKDTVLTKRRFTELFKKEDAKLFENEPLKNCDNFYSCTFFEPDIIYNTKVKILEFGFNKRYIVEFDLKCDIQTEIIKPKILLVEDSPVARKIVRRELNPEENKIELVEATCAEEALEILQSFMPCIIICDLVLPKMSGLQLIENIKQNPSLADIPVIVLSELTNMRVNKSLVDLGVNSFMQKPFKPTQLQERIALIRKQSKPCLDVKTKKAVYTLCRFTDTLHTWQLLKNKTAALLKYFDANDSEVAYGNYSLGLLAASSYDEATLNRCIEVANSMELSTKFLSFLDAIKNPVSTVEQIYAMTWKEFLELHGIESAHIVIDNKSIKKQLELFFANNKMTLSDGDGVKEAVNEYKSLLNATDLDGYIKNEYTKVIEKLLIHQLVFVGGGSCELRCDGSKVNFIFIPANEDMSNMENLMQHLESATANFNLTFEDVDNVTSLSITPIEQKSDDNDTADEVDAFMDFSNDECENQSLSDTPKIDASTFIRDNEIDMEDIESLEYLENDLFGAISEYSFCEDKNAKLGEIGELFRKYGTTIIYLREFNTISQSLTALATQLISTDIDAIDDTLAKMLPNILENLVTDLQSWRESIFVYTKADDVHFLDSSIVNNCSQCITFITPKTQTQEAEADIFF